jgi:hypothetical protein
MSERRGFVETAVGLAGVGAFVLGGVWVARHGVDMPARADRVGSGSDAAAAVAEENPPGGVPTVPQLTPEHTTPPLAEVPCTYEDETELDFRQTETAAGFIDRRHDEPTGAIAVCEGGLSAVGNPTSFEDGPLASYEVCGVLEPVANAGVESISAEGAQFVVVCYVNKLS